MIIAHMHTHTHMTRNNYRSPAPSTSLYEHTAHPIWWYLLACTIDVPCRQCDPRLRHDPSPRHTAARTEGLTQPKPKPKNISNAAAPRSRPLPVNVYVGEAMQTSTVEADEVEALVKCEGPVVVVHGFVVGVSPPRCERVSLLAMADHIDGLHRCNLGDRREGGRGVQNPICGQRVQSRRRSVPAPLRRRSPTGARVWFFCLSWFWSSCRHSLAHDTHYTI